MFKKAKLYSLLAIIVASTVVGLIKSPETALAQTTPSASDVSVYINPDMEPDLIAKQWREAMIGCINSSMYITHSDLASGNWFPYESTKNVGYLIDPTDGRYHCNEGGSAFVDGFIKVFGWKTPFEAACAIGFMPLSNTGGSPQDCLASDTTEGKDANYYYVKEDRGNFANDAINSQYGSRFNYGKGAPNDKQLYALYVLTFLKACQPSGAVETVPTGQVTAYSSKVTLVNADAEPVSVYYKIGNPGTKHVSYDRSNGGNAGLEMDCNGLADEITRLAPGYAEWVNGLGLSDKEKEAGTIRAAEGSPVSGGGGGGESASTCRVDGVGWIVCPVVSLAANMVDSSYYLLDNSLLRTPPIPLTNSDEPLYKAWKLMRDFANVVFVLIFLIIIFSQITSFGINNYGIKRLLPKLIVAAVLVNLSYIICAIAVDISNILGSQLKDLFDGMAQRVAPNENEGRYLSRAMSDGGGWSGVVGWSALTLAVLSAGGLAGGFFAVLAFLIPILFAALGAVLATVITLVLRQAFIIILVFISPLAFVALLLPNTESYFRKWRSAFQALLLLYPIIALVFGGSALASTLIMGAAEASHNGGADGEILGGITQTILQIAGAGISVVPLFIVPTIIKVAGGALNRFAGIVNNPNKGPIDALRNRSMKGVERMQKQQNLNTLRSSSRSGKRGRAMDFVSGRSKFRRDTDQEGIDAGIEAEISRAKTERKAELMTDTAGNPTDYARRVAGGDDTAAMERVQANAKFTLEKLELEEVKAAGVTVENMNLPQLRAIMDSAENSAAQKAAALNRMVTIGDPEDYEEYVNRYGTSTDSSDAIVRSTLSEALAKDGPGWLKGSDLDNIKNGQLGKNHLDKDGNVDGVNAGSLAEIARDNAKSGVESQAKMAADTKGNLEYLLDKADADGERVLGETAEALLKNPSLSGQIKHNREKIQELATYAPTPAAPPPPPPPPPPEPTFQAPRTAIDPSSGAVSQRPSSVSGATAVQQLHTFSGATGTVSADSIRAGLGKLSDEQLGQVIAHANANAATDNQYQGILRYARKEAARRNRGT